MDPKTKRILEGLQAQLKIDKNSLDEELVRQPSLYYEASTNKVMAASRLDKAKQYLSEIEAKEDRRIRLKLERDGKVTENKVSQELKLSKIRKEAHLAYLNAKETAEYFEALASAFLQRGYILRDLGTLYVAQYYSSQAVDVEESRRKLHSGRKVLRKR